MPTLASRPDGLLWLMPFLLAKRSSEPAKRLDRRARGGTYCLSLSPTQFCGRAISPERSPQPWQVARSIVFFALASLLSWTGARALGRQWRIDAGLRSQTGHVRRSYRLVRMIEGGGE